MRRILALGALMVGCSSSSSPDAGDATDAGTSTPDGTSPGPDGSTTPGDAGSDSATSGGDAGKDATAPDGAPCQAACAGKTCGPDGCGGVCGTCDSTHHCDNGACAPGGCTPNCLARQCGPDGCGGSCGACNPSFATCSSKYGLCVPNGAPAGLTVTWQQPCWQVWCDARFPGSTPKRYQAINFDHNMSFPIEGTLYANKICDPTMSSVGWNSDNLNDTGQATPPNIGEMWFINHPDVVPSSAVWWLGDNSSGCIDYSNLPDCPGGPVGCP